MFLFSNVDFATEHTSLKTLTLDSATLGSYVHCALG